MIVHTHAWHQSFWWAQTFKNVHIHQLGKAYTSMHEHSMSSLKYDMKMNTMLAGSVQAMSGMIINIVGTMHKFGFTIGPRYPKQIALSKIKTWNNYPHPIIIHWITHPLSGLTKYEEPNVLFFFFIYLYSLQNPKWFYEYKKSEFFSKIFTAFNTNERAFKINIVYPFIQVSFVTSEAILQHHKVQYSFIYVTIAVQYQSTCCWMNFIFFFNFK